MGLLDILSPISWIAGGVGDVFNDLLGGNGARKDQQKYNLQNMEIQQQYAQQNMATMNRYNIDAFNRENAWNAPTAQQQRNYAAGINPMWQDGSGAVVAQQDSGVSASAPAGSMPSAGNGVSLGDIVNLATASKQLKKLDSDIEVNDATIGEKQASAHKALTEADNIETQTNEFPSTAESQRRLNAANAGLAESQSGLTDEQKKYYKQDLDNRWDALKSEINLNDMKSFEIEKLLPANYKLLSAQAQYYVLSGVYQKVLSELEPQKVAIAKQQANAATEQAHASTISANADAAYKRASVHIQQFLASAEGRKLSADAYAQELQNTLDYELSTEGVLKDERVAQVNKLRKEVRALEQQYRKERPDAAFGDWLMDCFRNRPGFIDNYYFLKMVMGVARGK